MAARTSGLSTVDKWASAVCGVMRLVETARSRGGESCETREMAYAAVPQKRRRNSSKQEEVVAVHSEFGEVEVADAVVRLSVPRVGRVEVHRVVVRMSVVRHVAVACTVRLVGSVHSSLVSVVAAPYCHFSCGPDCDSDCAMAEADCDCGCDWQFDFYFCSDSDCDCDCCCDYCDRNAHQSYHPDQGSQQSADSQPPLRHWADGTDDAGLRMEPRDSHVAAGTRAAGAHERRWKR